MKTSQTERSQQQTSYTERTNIILLCVPLLLLHFCTVWVKKSPPQFVVFWHFWQTVENFKSVFYAPIIRSYLC